MFLTVLIAYVGLLSPSAQVWCGDQYLREVQATLAEKEYTIFPSHRSEIQSLMHEAMALKTEIKSKDGISKLRLTWQYLNACRETHRFTKQVAHWQE